MTHHDSEKAPATPRIAVSADPALDEVSAASQRRTLADSAPTSRLGDLGDKLTYLRGRGALEIGIIFVLVQIACIIWWWFDLSFPYLSSQNLGVLTQSIPVLGILAVGVGILMVAGEFDLSLGANFTFSALVYVRWYSGGHPIIAFVLALLVGTGIAVLNGVIVTRFRIPSFIATLGMGFFWTGAALFYNGTSSAQMAAGPTLTGIFTKGIGGIRGQLIWLIIIGAAFWVLLHRHRIGNHITAVGGNAAAARAISINPTRVKLLSFGILGFLTAFAAILTSIRTETIQPGSGEPFTLLAVAAAVVGGTSLLGGKGSVLGMIFGGALILTIQNRLQLGGAPGYYLTLFVGLIIVVASILNRLIEGGAT
jgi:simple sugar transport system permease protein